MISFIVLLSFAVCGYFLQNLGTARAKKLTDAVSSWLILVAMPALILLKLTGLALSVDLILPTLFAWLWFFLCFYSLKFLSKKLQWTEEIKIALILMTTLGNTAFLGVPLIMLFFKSSVISYGLLYDQFGSFFILTFVGIALIEKHKLGKQPPSEQIQNSGSNSLLLLYKVLRFPPFIALLLAFIVPTSWFPDTLMLGFEWLTWTFLPLSGLVLGLSFSFGLSKQLRAPCVLVIVTKIIIAPIFATLFCLALVNKESVMQAVIFQSAMPSMITPCIFAIQAGIAPRFISSTLGYVTLLSLAWLPMLAWLLN